MVNRSENGRSEHNRKARWKAVQAVLATCRKGAPLRSIESSETPQLSFGQERLWLLNQLGADNTVYNLPFAIWMDGTLDVTALEQSLQEIVRRHDSLRTSFPLVGTQIVPTIARTDDLKLSAIDLRQLPPVEQDVQYQRIAHDQMSTPFDLAHYPLWRFQLLQFTTTKYVLLMTIHHIIYDGWSQTVFAKELSILYKDFSTDQLSSLPNLPIQYADFADWQRQWLTGEILQTQKAYWQKQLAGELPTQRLPFERPQVVQTGSTGMTYKGERQPVAFSPELTIALQKLGDRQGVTLFVILLAAFNLLLYQYTKQEDIIVCSTQAGRNLSQVQDLIGFFNTVVPVRADLSGNPSFLDLVDRIHQVVLDGYQHQDLPLQLLADTHKLNQKRLYQVMLVLQNTPDERLTLPGIQVKSQYLANGTANFDLFLSLLSPESSFNQLTGYLEYKTDLFTSSAIAKLLEDFQVLLADLVENPYQHLSDLPLFVTQQERSSLATDMIRESTLFVTPRTPIEQQLAQIWSDLLGQEQIGIHDNFFALGGHSLLATQVISRVNTAFAAEIPILPIFKHPTIAALAEVIQTYLAQGQSGIPSVKIEPVSRKDKLPLSFAQQRLWFLDRFNRSAAYNLPIALVFRGALKVTALHRALQKIVNRHESLRTTFAANDGIPYQVIHSQRTIALPIVDLSAYEPAVQQLEVNRFVAAEATDSFDLSDDPMLRTTLLHLGQSTLECDRAETHHILLLTLHHIAADGWSIGVLLAELKALYAAFSQGQPSPLTDLAIQYADYAVWQRQYLQGEVLSHQLNYWKQYLANAPELLQLPTDYPRPAQERFQGAAVPVAIEFDLTQQLRQLSQQQDTTLYMTLLAAFQVLMARYTGQAGVVVGSPIANRNQQAIEPLIGCFVNTLALRADLSDVDGQPRSFLDVLAQVKEATQSAYDHQDLPFEQLVGELQLERNLNCHPLVQVFFVWHTIDLSPADLNGVTLVPLELETHTTRLDLELHFWEKADGLSGRCIYRTDLFKPSTIQRLMGHFQTLLMGIVAQPEQAIAQIPILTEAERHQLLVQWNHTKTEYPRDRLIHQLFEAQAERTPDAVAVVFATEQLTYQELNQQANQLAHYLQTLGVGSEVLVGICIERSLAMVIGMLGVLKAGGAYVPLDPDYPEERLQYMLSASQVPVLLTQQHLTPKLAAANTQLIDLDKDWPTIAQLPGENLAPLATPNSLAYVLYTSGSTGLPKGVAIEHHSPVALIDWARSVFSSEDLRGVLASTSICFDLSVFELFVTLSLGGKIILAENALQIPTLPAAQEITLINTVPSAIAALLRINAMPPHVCTVNLAGEPFPNELAQQLYQHSTIRRVFNLYGPSEDTTYSTVALVERGATSAPTIGRPIHNTVAYILDRHLQPVPIGISGELHIGGAGLARGYLNQPDLTQAKFIPNPFSHEPGARLYKTGDLARYLPDGNIEFLGRLDHQVKIRGFRIELGEIEAVLGQYPQIQHAVVVARTEAQGTPGLIAYLTPQSAESQLSTIRNYLRARLPGYMIPTAFVALDQIPQTPNGKVDRNALPVPSFSSSVVPDAPPHNLAEQKIAAVWRQVLNRQVLSIHDSFFEVGGHSLLAVQVHYLLSSEYPFLQLVDLFTYPSIHSLANYVSQQTSPGFSPTDTFKRSQDADTSQVRGSKRRAGQAVRQQRKQTLATEHDHE